MERSQQKKALEPGCHFADGRIREILDLHFHPQWGSAYWLERQACLNFDVRDRIRTEDDLWHLGLMPLQELRRRSVRDFVPKALQRQWPRFIVGETAGTSGSPCATVFRDDEFQAAFIEPFLRVAEATSFPRETPWLWVGPSGPHIIGKVVRELARQTGSADPFSVDFDPRWAKRLADGSTARQRYLDHVLSQALDVLNREDIGVLFITPPTLKALTPRLTDHQREAIRGIHYGGVALDANEVNFFRSAYPGAVHLAGYGNTLFGVIMEVEDAERSALDYYPLAERVRFQIVDPTISDETCEPWPALAVRRGDVGRVMFHRFDESALLIGVLERDEAERIAPSETARRLGCRVDGLRNPRPPASLAGKLQTGLY